MAIPDTYDFQRYLAAKRSVEARALNAHVWAAMAEATRGAKQVLELGAGIGSMARRFADAGLLEEANYQLVEPEGASLAAAKEELASSGWIHFSYAETDAYSFLAENQGWDLIVAHALLDLLDLDTALDAILGALNPGGHFYFPVNYDGLTIFEPELDAVFEAELIAAYHRTMDGRVVAGKASGDSRTGRHLLAALAERDAELLGAGSSDWVVAPRRKVYAGDEAYFLHHVLHFFEESLRGEASLDQQQFEQWLAARRAQIEQGELIYVAHQLDVFGRGASR
jgi:SAM-dependent methyltransferase